MGGRGGEQGVAYPSTTEGVGAWRPGSSLWYGRDDFRDHSLRFRKRRYSHYLIR